MPLASAEQEGRNNDIFTVQNYTSLEDQTHQESQCGWQGHRWRSRQASVFDHYISVLFEKFIDLLSFAAVVFDPQWRKEIETDPHFGWLPSFAPGCSLCCLPFRDKMTNRRPNRRKIKLYWSHKKTPNCSVILKFITQALQERSPRAVRSAVLHEPFKLTVWHNCGLRAWQCRERYVYGTCVQSGKRIRSFFTCLFLSTVCQAHNRTTRLTETASSAFPVATKRRRSRPFWTQQVNTAGPMLFAFLLYKKT